MPLPTPTDLTTLQNLLQNNVVDNLGGVTTGETIYNFLNNLTNTNWINLDVGIQDFLTKYSGEYTGLRVQISRSNGYLVYDSNANNNSYQNALNNTIGSNINVLVSVTNALQSGTGYEYQNQESTQYGKYVVGYNALRKGSSVEDALGCSVVSYEAINYY